MIIIPAALYLSPSLNTPLTHARILYDTYTRDALPSQITASASGDEYPSDAPTRPDTYERWKPDALPATWEIDFGENKDMDAVGIVAMGNSGIKFLIETSTDGVTYTTFSEEFMPSDDAPMLFLDDERAVRHLRLTLSSDLSPAEPPQIAVIYAHRALAMQRMIHGGHSPANLSRNTVLMNALSRGGQFLGQNIRRMGVSTEAAFTNLTGDWYRDNFDPFVRSARKYPYFFSWRPARRPLEVAYVWTDKDIAPRNQGGKDMVSVSFNMQGIGYSE